MAERRTKNMGMVRVMLEHGNGTRFPIDHPEFGGKTDAAERWAKEQPEVPGFSRVIIRDMRRVSYATTLAVEVLGASADEEGDGAADPEPKPAPAAKVAPKPKAAPKPKPAPAAKADPDNPAMTDGPKAKDLLATGGTAKAGDNPDGDHPF